MIKIQIKWKSRRLSFLCMRVSAQKFAWCAYFCSGVHRRRPRRNEGGKLHLEIFASSSQMPVWISVHPTANGQNKLQVSQTLFDDPLGNIPASNLFIGSRRPRPKTQVKAILNLLRLDEVMTYRSLPNSFRSLIHVKPVNAHKRNHAEQEPSHQSNWAVKEMNVDEAINKHSGLSILSTCPMVTYYYQMYQKRLRTTTCTNA